MHEDKLKSVLRLFALVATVNYSKNLESIHRLIGKYLDASLSDQRSQWYDKIFNFYYQLYSAKILTHTEKVIAKYAVKILRISYELKNSLLAIEKSRLVMVLFAYLREEHSFISQNAINTLTMIVLSIGVEDEECKDINALFIKKGGEINRKESLLKINDMEYDDRIKHKHISRKNLNGEIVLYFITSLDMFIFCYFGNDDILFNGKQVIEGDLLLFEKGSIIHGSNIRTINYGEINVSFSIHKIDTPIYLKCDSIGYTYKGTKTGLVGISSIFHSGEFVGILGASGTGKTTLLNVLNGNIKPDSGSVFINGYDVHKETNELKGIIGYVPQGDYLVEELTVNENLFYTSKLCYGNLTNHEIRRKIAKLLIEFDLPDIKDHKVGPVHKSNISGGQRKRINVILELLREPKLLFVDEPTSGLSYVEAYKTIELLKEQTKDGKIIVCTLHQPSSEVFSLLNKLIILDKGGLPIFYGNPSEAIVHFKTSSKRVNPLEIKCASCGNINTGQIFDIIEEREIDDYGRFTGKRKKVPEYWHYIYKKGGMDEGVEEEEEEEKGKMKLPEKSYKIPDKLHQFGIYLQRNIISKLTNKQYLLIAFLEAPLLAFILSVFAKFIKGTEANPDQYIFSDNVNIPAYFFMSILVALFIGMMISAEEIFRDRKQLIREKYINLSRVSYIHSKIAYLFVLSLIQTFLFILVGNFILGIKGIGLYNWLILFSVSCFANIVGLNISSTLNSVVAIYILIPLLIIPQILLGGVIIEYNKISKGQKAYIYTPFYGDIMVTRWAYEALMVKQFADNEYNRLLFDIDKKISNTAYLLFSWQPAILEEVKEIRMQYEKGETLNTENVQLLKNEISTLYNATQWESFKNFTGHNKFVVSHNTINQLENLLHKLKNQYNKEYLDMLIKRDSIIKSVGEEEITRLRENHYNNKVAEFVLRRNDVTKMVIYNNRFIRVSEPVFKKPDRKNGRAHLYSSVKILGPFEMDTVWFNLFVIWFMVLFCYVLLYFDLLKKLFVFRTG